MTKLAKLFDEQWMQDAQTATSESWACDVLASRDTIGGMYLCQLRTWFEDFPSKTAPKQHLRMRLQSLNNNDHLGGVNELAWWALMRREDLNGEPLSPSSGPSPDFKLTSPVEWYVEVSTLNVSDADRKSFEANQAVDLTAGRTETLRRIARKASKEKKDQLHYAAKQAKPCVLALFDYTTFSGFCTQFFRHLGEFLLGTEFGFKNLPNELSALVYLERKVIFGRIAVSLDRSAVYYNPLARFPIPTNAFACFNQFAAKLLVTERNATEHWLWL
jgi:hypothetical protein